MNVQILKTGISQISVF